MKQKRGGYRVHKRSALKHFRNQWRARIADEMPSIDLLRAELQKAVEGRESTFFTLVTFNHYSTRWRSEYAGKTIIVAYDHRLRVPVSVWEEGVDYRKVSGTPVIMENYRHEQVKKAAAAGAAETSIDAGTDAEPVEQGTG